MILEVVERMWFHYNTEPKVLDEFLPGQRIKLNPCQLFVLNIDKVNRPPRIFTPVSPVDARIGASEVLVDPIELVRKCKFITDEWR